MKELLVGLRALSGRMSAAKDLGVIRLESLAIKVKYACY